MDGMPVTAPRGQWLADAPCRQSIYRSPPSREAAAGGGEALGGPDVGHGVHSGAYVPFLPSDGGRSGPRVPPVAPSDGQAGPVWSGVVSEEAAATTDTARRYVPTCGGSRVTARRSGITGSPTTPPHTLLGPGRRTMARPPPPDARTGTSVQAHHRWQRPGPGPTFQLTGFRVSRC